MRLWAAGVVVAAGLLIAVLGVTVDPHAVFADRVGPSPVNGSSQLVTLLTPLADNRQQLLVIDPELHMMGVYHLDAGGQIVLKKHAQISSEYADGRV